MNDNSNEIIVLKARIRDLEKRLNIREKVPNSPMRRRFYSECIDDSKDSVSIVEDGNDAADDLRRQLGESEQLLEEKQSVVREREEESLDLHKRLQETEEEAVRSGEEARMLKRKTESLELHQVDSLRRIDEMKFESENLSVENRRLVDENQGLSSANSRLKVRLVNF